MKASLQDTHSAQMGPPPTGKKKRELLPCTRYGPVHSPVTKLGTEERFAWQKPQFSSDVMYELPPVTMSRVVSFPSAVRGGMDDLANPDAKKRSTGPGSYNPETCFDRLSDYCVHRASRFADAPRQSMDMKTPSPGAVYNVEKCYWNGPVKTIGISFNKDQRCVLVGLLLLHRCPCVLTALFPPSLLSGHHCTTRR